MVESGQAGREPDEPPPAGPRLGLRAGISLDLETAGRAFPLGRWIVPLAALAIGAGIGWLRPGYGTIYSESLPVLIALATVGSFGRMIGVLVLAGFAATDLAHFVLIPDHTIGAALDRNTLVGRVVTEGVMALLLVVVPSFARRFEWIVEDRLGDGVNAWSVGGAVGAVVAAVGAYLWANVMPYLVRAAYVYSPPPNTLQPQLHPEQFAIAVGAGYLVVAFVLRRRVVAVAELGPIVGGLPRRGIGGLAVRVVGYAVAILLMAGIMSGPRDAAILAAGFAVGELAAWLASRDALTRLVRGIPSAAVSFGGLALTFVVAVSVGNVANSAWPKGLDDSLFMPILVATASAFPVARFGLALAEHASGRGLPIPVPAALLWALAIVAVVALVFPSVTLADNCSGLGDCGFSQRFLLVIAGFAAFFGAGAAAASGGGGGGGGDGGAGGGGKGGGKSQPKGPPPPPPQKPGEEY